MNTATLDAYIFFINASCREGMTFYQNIFGGELNFMDMPDDPDKKVMHAHLKGGLIALMGSDGDRTTPYEGGCISLSITGSDEEKLHSVFDQLAEGGKVESPLKVEMWGDTFGMLTDKYGVDWMVNITKAA